jgi:hypothetical protein
MWGEEKPREYLQKARFRSIATNRLARDIQNNWQEFWPSCMGARHQSHGRYPSRLRSRWRKRRIRYAAIALNGSSPIV